MSSTTMAIGVVCLVVTLGLFTVTWGYRTWGNLVVGFNREIQLEQQDTLPVSALTTSIIRTRYVGHMRYPRIVYAGSSEIVILELYRDMVVHLATGNSVREKMVKTGSELDIETRIDTAQQNFLEAELLLGGLDVKPSNAQRCSFGSPKLIYRWAFDISEETGNRKMLLTFRRINDANTVELGTVEADIRVNRIDHLSQRTARKLTYAALILSLIFAGISAAKDLGDGNSANLPEVTPEVTQSR